MLVFPSKIAALEYSSVHEFMCEFIGDDSGMFHGTLIGASYPFLIQVPKEPTPQHRKNIILSLSGKAQSGKNTTATLVAQICREMGSKYAVKELAFADYLKQIAREEYGWDSTDKAMYPPEVTDKGRNLLIWLAKKYRDENPDFWANVVINKLDQEHVLGTTPTLWVITDCRYRNEIKLLRHLEIKHCGNIKVFCVKVTRPDELKIDDPSEKDLEYFFGFDRTLKNNGTMEDLKRDVSYTLTDLEVI